MHDLSAFEWALEGRFLRVRYHAEQGDSFAAEGYLWYSGAERRVHFHEFSTGARPVRVLTGTCTTDGLVLDEEPSDRRVRLAVRFIEPSMFELTEADTRGERPEVFVRMLFKKQARGAGES